MSTLKTAAGAACLAVVGVSGYIVYDAYKKAVAEKEASEKAATFFAASKEKAALKAAEEGGLEPSFHSIGTFDIDGSPEIIAEAFRSQDSVPGQTHTFPNAQDHLPLAYAIARNFISESEMAQIHQWFRGQKHDGIKMTEFNGDAIADGTDLETVEDAVVRQLYGNPEPFKENFPGLYSRVLALKDGLGTKLAVDEEELSQVNFAQDIRYITYKKGDYCMWHRDDPVSHFNTIMMISRPGVDFEGGQLQFHPTDNPTDVLLERGDAVIYSTPKVDHAVTHVTSGTRTICLVELKMEEFATKGEPSQDKEGWVRIKQLLAGWLGS